MSMCSATATEETSGTLLSSCYSLPSASRQSCTHVQRLPSPSLILRLERSMHDSQLKLEQGTLAYFSAYRLYKIARFMWIRQVFLP